MSQRYFREYEKSNLTGTSIEAVWLLRMALLTVGAHIPIFGEPCRLNLNRNARAITKWRKEAIYGRTA